MEIMSRDNFAYLVVNDIVNIGGKMKIIDMLKLFENVVKDNIPEDKRYEDFTGGYIQQLSNSNQLVLYFGYKTKYDELEKKYVNTKNRATSVLNISSEEIDIFYVGLKIMVAHIKLNKHSGKNKNVSMLSYINENIDLDFSNSKKDEPMCLLDRFEDG
mgnify:FL=1